jgi:hypothetical protein
MPAGYSKRSLVEKLGIKPGSRMSIVHPPGEYHDVLGPLPDGVVRHPKPTRELDFVQAFFFESKHLEREFPGLKKAIKPNGTLWISWPKKTSKLSTDLSEDVVRDTGLKHGLVDVKVCAVDDVWSGLKFMYRLTDRP